MINAYQAKKYCSEDLSLIENYQAAISDEERMWEIHHRRECDSEGRTLFTRKQLIEMNLYVKRPASELRLVTKSMHKKLHREMCSNGGKIGGKIGGKKSKKNNTKAVTIGGVQYESKKDAMEKLGIGRKKLESLINSQSISKGAF